MIEIVEKLRACFFGWLEKGTPEADLFIFLFFYLFIYRFVQCAGERTIGHVVPYLVHPPNPPP